MDRYDSNNDSDAVVFGKIETIYCCVIPPALRSPDAARIFRRVLSDRGRTVEQIDRLEHAVSRLLHRDLLTKLPNSKAFFDVLSGVLEQRVAMHQNPNGEAPIPYSVIECDINNFGTYNNMFGQPTTNGLVQQFARLLAEAVRLNRRTDDDRANDFLSRTNTQGDEFRLLMPDATEKEATLHMAGIQKTIAEKKFLLKTPAGNHFLLSNLTFAVGCYQLDSRPAKDKTYDNDPLEVIDKAEIAMKTKKFKMKHSGQADVHIEEIRDPARLAGLQADEAVVKVGPVTPPLLEETRVSPAL